MARYLLIDVGAGTMDVLWYDDAHPLQYKAVVPSPVRALGDVVASSSGDLVVSGGEMGGGPVSKALVERAETHCVVMSRSAAATIHHDMDRVRSRGIEVLEGDHDDERVRELQTEEGYAHVRLADIDAHRLRDLIAALGLSGKPDIIGCCAQDHGIPPKNVSHLDHRHTLLAERLEIDPDLRKLLFESTSTGGVPSTFNRLRTMAEDASALEPARVFVMDSGMAAIVGARLDPRCREVRKHVVLDIATSHTVAAAYDGDELCGFVEYHTKDLTVERLDDVIEALVAGELEHAQVLAEGGHGAFMRRPLGKLDELELIVATGPKRSMLPGAASRLSMAQGAPLGDTMMTGTAGLLAAIRFGQGLAAPLAL